MHLLIALFFAGSVCFAGPPVRMTDATLTVLAVNAKRYSAQSPSLSPEYSGESTDREALYKQGIPFDDFLSKAEKRRDRWVRNFDNGRVEDAALMRARNIPGTWRLLVVAVDGCSDSVSTIPYLAHLEAGLPNLEMRIIDSTLGREIMLAHTTADGRAATPTIVLLNERYEEVGCFIERPALLQAWATENKDSLSGDEFLAQKFSWYDADAGEHTIGAIVDLMEAAAAGKTGC